ncbi:MAG: AbrB/MazE/SpoVT family DNA-binding domain-containing protein [Candidatus Sumerlaeaceae bacterium]
MSAVTVSPKYQIVIPKDVRESMKIKPGDRLTMVQIGERIQLVRYVSIEDVRGLLKGMNTDNIRDEEDRY